MPTKQNECVAKQSLLSTKQVDDSKTIGQSLSSTLSCIKETGMTYVPSHAFATNLFTQFSRHLWASRKETAVSRIFIDVGNLHESLQIVS
ncbi:hypothetical protein [Candidatus Leptofilum sp.]|uniref:hypothetical protein n=1 Tax=Candidatus Leptofilum sp. TaxID=3241576 RepID=UPI003B5CDB4B